MKAEPSDASAESSSEERGGAALPTVKEARRQRMLQLGFNRRLRRMLNRMEEKGIECISFLESCAVTASTLQKYTTSERDWRAWCEKTSVPLGGDDEVDAALVDYMNWLWLQGHRPWRGERLMAAMLALHPAYNKTGSRKLPRAWRGLQGWRRICPGGSRSL